MSRGEETIKDEREGLHLTSLVHIVNVRTGAFTCVVLGVLVVRRVVARRRLGPRCVDGGVGFERPGDPGDVRQVGRRAS